MDRYYRKFCLNFSAVEMPLTARTSIQKSFERTTEARQAFDHLKAFLSSSLVLRAPDDHQPFHLSVNASGIGVGAVLRQCDPDAGILHPSAYYSARLKPHEIPCSTLEKEALTLVIALKEIQYYLLHHPEVFKVYSVHNPVTFNNRARLKNQWIMRWALLLQEYNISVQHIRGAENILADCLSRSLKSENDHNRA